MGAATADPPAKEAKKEDDGTVPGSEGTPPTPPAKLPDDGNGNEEEPNDQLVMQGFRPIGVVVGGKEPESAVLKIKGQRVELEASQFDRGDRFLTVDVLQITGSKDADSINRLSGEIKTSSREQTATICSTSRIESWLYRRLADAMPADQVEAVFTALELDIDEGRE